MGAMPERMLPQQGGFYAGWITSQMQGRSRPIQG